MFQSKLQASTSDCGSDEVSRVLLYELPPLNCENEAKVGSDKTASPHLVNFIPGQTEEGSGETKVILQFIQDLNRPPIII